MASLYELTNDALALQEMLESGEIDEQTFNDTIEALDVDTKIENICKMIRNLEADATAYKAEKDRLAAKEKSANNAVDRLKENLLNHLLTLDKKKANAGTFTVSVGKSKSLNVIYEDMLPEQFFIPQPPKIDKTGITKAIKAGENIVGAELVEKPYVTIR